MERVSKKGTLKVKNLEEIKDARTRKCLLQHYATATVRNAGSYHCSSVTERPDRDTGGLDSANKYNKVGIQCLEPGHKSWDCKGLNWGKLCNWQCEGEGHKAQGCTNPPKCSIVRETPKCPVFKGATADKSPEPLPHSPATSLSGNC